MERAATGKENFYSFFFAFFRLKPAVKRYIGNTSIVIHLNYLAHAYLSFNQPAILAGNLFSDFVKGKQVNLYPE
ncbi:MAG: hypothetical protein ACJ751_01815, partial [Niastella sp.]